MGNDSSLGRCPSGLPGGVRSATAEAGGMLLHAGGWGGRETQKPGLGDVGDGRTGDLLGVHEKASRGRKVTFHPPPG